MKFILVKLQKFQLQKKQLDIFINKYIGQTLLIRPDINSDKDLLKLNKAIEDKQYVKRAYYAFLYNNSNSKDLKDIISQDNKKFEKYDKIYTAKQTVQKVRRK